MKHDTFGSLVPFAEPCWYQGAASHFCHLGLVTRPDARAGFPSPYYTAAHAQYRNKLREFVEKGAQLLRWAKLAAFSECRARTRRAKAAR